MRGFIAVLLLSAVAPGVWEVVHRTAPPNEVVVGAAEFPGWPTEIGGRSVERLPLTDSERGFADAFPGKVARFSDGEQQYILRWITKATRRLHPAAHCLRASGYSIGQEKLCDESALGPGEKQGTDATAACYEARRDGRALFITEHIYDEVGARWTHVSQWYWAAALGRSAGPWWALTTVRSGGAADGGAR